MKVKSKHSFKITELVAYSYGLRYNGVAEITYVGKDTVHLVYPESRNEVGAPGGVWDINCVYKLTPEIIDSMIKDLPSYAWEKKEYYKKLKAEVK